MTAHHANILWLNHTNKADQHIVGEKATTLGELKQSGFPIPDGFVVTSLSYFHFLHENKLISKINQLLSTINYEHPESVMQVANHIQNIIRTTKISEAFASTIQQAYHELNGSFVNAPVLIHISPLRATSSSLAETFSNIHGDTNLMLKIKEAWIALFEPQMILNRHTKHIDHFQEGIAVVIQKMIQAEKTGVIMTIDPVTQDKTRLVLEVSDQTTDHYVIDKTTSKGQILEKNVAGEKQKISDEQIQTLTKLGKDLEKHLYFPQEIAFTLEKDTISITEVKPLHLPVSEANQSVLFPKLPVLLKGIPASRGIVTGHVRQITQSSDLEKITHGDIVVAATGLTSHKSFLKKARGIVIDSEGRTSPIALLARESGIPSIVGTHHATQTIKTGQLITIDGTNGYIYNGAVTNTHIPRLNVTKIFTVLSDESNTNERHTDGILFIPQDYLPQNQQTLATLCANAGNHPVLYRIPDPLPQNSNPIIGFRGTYHLLHKPELFKKELEAVQQENIHHKNLALVLPFVRYIHELITAKHIMTNYGLSRDTQFDLWIELATPSNALLLNEFLQAGIDGIVIDFDTLSMLLIGTDKNNSEVTHAYDALDPSILHTLEKSIKTAHSHGIKTTIYGKALSQHPSLIEKLVTWGITSIAVTPEKTDAVKNDIIETERRLIESRL